MFERFLKAKCFSFRKDKLIIHNLVDINPGDKIYNCYGT